MKKKMTTIMVVIAMFCMMSISAIAATHGYVVSADSYVVIEEGTGNYNINLKDGFANTNPVNLQFRGNTNAGAMATVSYYAN